MVDKAFSEINPKLRDRLVQLREEGSAIKGVKDPKEEAITFFARKRPKTSRQWNNMRYFLMQRIDKARVKLGLAPIYFVREP